VTSQAESAQQNQQHTKTLFELKVLLRHPSSIMIALDATRIIEECHGKTVTDIELHFSDDILLQAPPGRQA
jgi:hypothetical protein